MKTNQDISKENNTNAVNMKAVVCERYGPPDVLKLTETKIPVPIKNEVLVKMYATTVNAADCNTRGLSYIPKGLGLLARLMIGIKKPNKSILGSVIAGKVEEIGPECKLFKKGDEVFGTGDELGGYAEFACRPETGALILKPANLSYEEAASIPYGALTALYFLRDKAGVKSGQRVLIRGASGGVGVYAVQLAKILGAEVTGVCSTNNVDFVKSLGTDEVIDYTKEDFASMDKTWDVILDIVVRKTSFSKYKKVINPGGYYLAIAGGLGDMLQMIATSILGNRKVIFGGGTECEKIENFLFLRELIDEGKLKPIIDKVFPLERIVDAHSYAESGNKKGNIVVSIK